MTRRKLIAASALAAFVAAGAATSLIAGPAAAEDEIKFEKCYGIAKAGHNDCQTATSSCAGTSKADNQSDAFVFLPGGTCGKIAGGNLEPAS